MSNVPDGATVSDDGNFWWDGVAWQPVAGATPGDSTATSPDDSGGSDVPIGDGAARTVPAPDGPIILFEPGGGSTTVAIFAHAVEDAGNELDPMSGVTLGYYSPHGDPLDANITWAADPPTHAPQTSEGQPNGQWASYVLTTIPLSDEGQADLADRAEEYGIAIAYVVEPTTTPVLISQLVGLGYADVRGVHCRAAADDDDTESPSFGASIEVTHATLVADHWKDSAFDDITDDTDLAAGEPIADSNGNYYKIVSVGDPPKSTYQIEPHTG